MRKFVAAVGLAVMLGAVSASSVFGQPGQTVYYKYIETVDENTGVRSNKNHSGMYLTFTGNSCYESDSKGIKTGIVYSYQGKQDGTLVFINEGRGCSAPMCFNTTYGGMGYMYGLTCPAPHYSYKRYFSFNESYTRMNRKRVGSYSTGSYLTSSYNDEDIDIYEKSTPPPPPKDPGAPPSKFY